MPTRRLLATTVLAAVLTSVVLAFWLYEEEPDPKARPSPTRLDLSVPIAAPKGASPSPSPLPSPPRVERLPPPSAGYPAAPSVIHVVTCRASFTNSTRVAATVRMQIPRATSRPPFTQVLDVRFDPSPASVVTDVFGNPFAQVERVDVPPGETREVTMTARIQVYQVVVDVDARRVHEVASRDATLAPFLAAEKGFPVDDPVIRRAAADIVAGERNPWYRLVALYDYTRALDYQLTHHATDVLEVLKTHVAQCSDAASLLLTLARAAAVPTRYIGGLYVLDDSTSTSDTHAWTEAYIAGLGWLPLDPTQARFDDALRVSRLAEEVTGYVPLWTDTASAFKGQVLKPSDNGDASAHFSLAFDYRTESMALTPSLLTRFPVPRPGATASSPSGDDTVWEPWQEKIATASRGAGLDSLRAEAGRSALPPWLRTAIMGVCDQRNDHLGLAEEELIGAVNAHPGALTHALLAGFYVWTHQVSRALDQYQQGLRVDPSSLRVWRALIAMYASLEIWDGVAQAAQMAARLHPEQVAFVSEEGQAWMRMHAYAAARDAFRRVVEKTPKDGWAYAMLGWAERETGDLAAARQSLSHGLSLGIDGAERPFFERMLAGLPASMP